jgi:hypothetical protein
LTAVSEDSADAAKHDVYGPWRRIRCPGLLFRANSPLAPGGGLVVSAQDSERFAAETSQRRVLDLDSNHYTVLIEPVANDALVRFLRG